MVISRDRIQVRAPLEPLNEVPVLPRSDRQVSPR